MNKKTALFATLLLGFGLTVASAQESANIAGGEASGSGGTVSYSVGQHSYTLPSALLAGAGKTVNIAGTTFQTINVKTNGADKITGAFIITETTNILATLGSYMTYTNLISDRVSKWYVVSAYY